MTAVVVVVVSVVCPYWSCRVQTVIVADVGHKATISAAALCVRSACTVAQSTNPGLRPLNAGTTKIVNYCWLWALCTYAVGLDPRAAWNKSCHVTTRSCAILHSWQRVRGWFTWEKCEKSTMSILWNIDAVSFHFDWCYTVTRLPRRAVCIYVACLHTRLRVKLAVCIASAADYTPAALVKDTVWRTWQNALK